MHYLPLSPPFFLALAGLFVLLAGAVVVGILDVRMGIRRRYVFAVLLLSLVGSYFNIPVAEFPGKRVVLPAEIVVFGIHYLVPVVENRPGTVLAVNVGGAVVPTLLSLYLLARRRLYWRSLVGTAVVAAVCYAVARPIPGMGIVVPAFVPPLATLIVALALSRTQAAPLAYLCGTLGTLIGADLLNLGRIVSLGAPIVSIGGAGTFDGIFVTGLVAVLLAGIATWRTAAPRP